MLWKNNIRVKESGYISIIRKCTTCVYFCNSNAIHIYNTNLNMVNVEAFLYSQLPCLNGKIMFNNCNSIVLTVTLFVLEYCFTYYFVQLKCAENDRNILFYSPCLSRDPENELKYISLSPAIVLVWPEADFRLIWSPFIRPSTTSALQQWWEPDSYILDVWMAVSFFQICI